MKNDYAWGYQAQSDLADIIGKEDAIAYRNELIENYKKRIEYLENENKRLLDVIAFKEQKELVKDTKLLDNKEKKSFFSCFFNRFKG